MLDDGRVGLGDATLSIDVPIGHQLVEQLVRGVGLDDAVVAPQAVEGLGDLALAVLVEGEANLVHIRALQAPGLRQQDRIFRMALEQRPPSAAGRDSAVLRGVAGEAQRSARGRAVAGQAGEVAVWQRRGLVDGNHAAVGEGERPVVEPGDQAGHRRRGIPVAACRTSA